MARRETFSTSGHKMWCHGNLHLPCSARNCVFFLFLFFVHLGWQWEHTNSRVEATVTENGDKVIQIGVILPDKKNTYPWSMKKVKPGISIAVDWVNSRPDLLPGYVLKMNTYDSECSDIYGPLWAIDMYLNKKANVFLGPACDYSIAPIARLSPFWDIPMITAGALVQAFKDKTVYSLLTRIQGTYDKLGRSLAYIYTKFFNWYRPCLVYTMVKGSPTRSPCHFQMEAVYTFTRVPLKGRYPGEDIWYTSFEEREASDEFFEELLREKVYKNCRIVLLCASSDSIRSIMLQAHKLGFTNGDFAFVNIDLFSSKIENERPWYRQTDTYENNIRARQAYESLMIVTLRKPESQEYHRFSLEVKRRALAEYGNFSHNPEQEVNSFVGAFHDAVILYSLALNETLAAGGQATNGSLITQHMWNRTFQGITGTVHIDANGDRNADYSILDMNPTTGTFQVISNFYGSHRKYEPVVSKRIQWAGGLTGPPPDKPKCGFDGSDCPKKDPDDA